MTLAVVRNIGSAAALRTAEDVAAFEQEIADQYALAMAAAGVTTDTSPTPGAWSSSSPGR